MLLGFEALQRRQGYPRLCGKIFLNQTKIFLSNETQYPFIVIEEWSFFCWTTKASFRREKNWKFYFI